MIASAVAKIIIEQLNMEVTLLRDKQKYYGVLVMTGVAAADQLWGEKAAKLFIVGICAELVKFGIDPNLSDSISEIANALMQSLVGVNTFGVLQGAVMAMDAGIHETNGEHASAKFWKQAEAILHHTINAKERTA